MLIYESKLVFNKNKKKLLLINIYYFYVVSLNLKQSQPYVYIKYCIFKGENTPDQPETMYTSVTSVKTDILIFCKMFEK